MLQTAVEKLQYVVESSVYFNNVGFDCSLFHKNDLLFVASFNLILEWETSIITLHSLEFRYSSSARFVCLFFWVTLKFNFLL